MDEPPFALVRLALPASIVAKGGSFFTVSTLVLFSSTSIACGSYMKSKGLPVIRREPLGIYNVVYATAFLQADFSYRVADHGFQCWHREIATIFYFPLFFLCSENPATIPLMNRMKRTNHSYTDLLLYPRHRFSDYYFITRMLPTPYSFSCIHITASRKAMLSPPVFCALRILCFRCIRRWPAAVGAVLNGSGAAAAAAS